MNLANYPPKNTLIEAWLDAHERLIGGVKAASLDTLAEPNDYHRPDLLPTVCDFLAYSIIGHTALHLGQLSAWRRAMSRPAFF